MIKTTLYSLIFTVSALMFASVISSCGENSTGKKGFSISKTIDELLESDAPDEYTPVNTLLLVPANPIAGENFRLVSTGGKNIRKSTVSIIGPSGTINSISNNTGKELPCWRIDHFKGIEAGNYKAILREGEKELCTLSFEISTKPVAIQKTGVWKTTRSWDSATETLYSAWVNALFSESGEQDSWAALHEVTQNKDRNFLYNNLSLNEDDPTSKIHVSMEPDCADNPFFLRAYFSWKLGLPFGYHIADRGWIGKAPSTGQWVTNETSSSKGNPVQSFNSFIRMVMNGVHSGTARTSLENENADYYPVPLTRSALRPGVVFADPYGHTFVMVSWIPQTKQRPGVLLAADAQPDKTIAIKRFWKGNFLFNTSEVIGEPGFKAFRPIVLEDGRLQLVKNEKLNENSGFVPFSLQQKNMESEQFYQCMERVINPKPLDAEETLNDLISALHEQLLVRVKSVSNGENYIKSHPGTIIPMPSGAKGVFQTGGLWEDYSTPNRDLRLLIAIDAVINFPARVAKYPGNYKLPSSTSVTDIQQKLQTQLEKKVANLSISYTRSNGSEQRLTLQEILDRREALEMAYNPNDGIEIRWGAPENSDEISTCKRRAPSNQRATMQSVRKWFNQRLHPPT